MSAIVNFVIIIILMVIAIKNLNELPFILQNKKLKKSYYSPR